MGFNTDYKNVGTGSELMPEGYYEFIFKNAEQKTAKSGKLYISFDLVVRNDVEQKYKNKHIFEAMFKKKEPTEADNQVEGYSYARLMSIAKAAKLPEGKNYPTINTVLQDLINKPVQCLIEHQEDNKGDTVERVRYFNETECPDCKHEFKTSAITANNQGFAQPPKQEFANQIPQPQVQAMIGDLSDFEEIITDGDIPF